VRSCLVWFVGASASIPVWFVACSEPAQTPVDAGYMPHLLVVTLDTTRADRLGCYGYDEPTSPNLDRLARESTQFDLAIAQAAVTPVSHASIFTGLNPHHHGLRVLHGRTQNRLADTQRTLAEVWHDAGGMSAAFVSAFTVLPIFGLDQGFDHFDGEFPERSGENRVSPEGVVNTERSQRGSDETTQAALDWMEKEADPSKPLFLWVHYFDPHDSILTPPKSYLDQFESKSEKPRDVLRAKYDAEIRFMDDQLGRLVKSLRKNDFWDKMIVVVVADHGQGLGDHDWWNHGILFQEQIRVPLLIRVPGVGRGTRVPSLVRTIDIMPTVLEAAGVDPSLWPSMDGSTLGGAMRTGRTAEPREAYADSVNIMSYGRPDDHRKRDHNSDKLYCLMTDRYKLIYHQLFPDQTQFFDIQEDPRELEDLAQRGLPATRSEPRGSSNWATGSEPSPSGLAADAEVDDVP